MRMRWLALGTLLLFACRGADDDVADGDADADYMPDRQLAVSALVNLYDNFAAHGIANDVRYTYLDPL